MSKKLAIMLAVLLLITACVPQEQKTMKMDIPFVKQKGPSCVPSQVTMALQHYYPEKGYTLQQIDDKIGRKEDKWAWFSQALPVLVEEGLNAYYYSITPYYQLTPEFVLEYYGQDDGELINEVTDWEELEKSINFLKTTNRHKKKKLSWQEIEMAFSNNNIILMIIDYNVLMNTPGRYAGHGVTITQINQTHVLFHNSAKGPNQKATKQDFIKAWDAPGTDNDAIIIRGKIK